MTHPDYFWLIARPIAHRGLHDLSNDIVENTPSAFKGAIAHNFAIETDLQITKDGKAAVFHDDRLDRLTQATGHVDEHTMAELSAIDFQTGSDRILELSQLLEIVAGQVPLVLELKIPRINDGRLERAVCEAISRYDGKVALMSFSPQIVETLIPMTDRPRGIVACNFERDADGSSKTPDERFYLSHLLHSGQSKPDFISYCEKDLPAPSVSLLKALFDLPVICWTTRDTDSHIRALKFCDQVTFEGYNPDCLT